MSTGPSNPDSGGARPAKELTAEEARQAAQASAGQFDPALLERVVRQTLTDDAERDESVAGDLQRLRSIAHRRKGQNLVLEPVVIEMVRAMLGAQFAGLDADPERFRDITMKIARTLLDDPVACKRLENLWSRLGEGS